MTIRLSLSEHLREVILLALLLLLAALLRIWLSSGVVGSDNVVYLTQAYNIASGVYEAPTYIAHLRIGNILPIALMFKIFGQNSYTIFLWSLVASLINILVIYLISQRLFSPKVAILTAFCAVFYPLDIHMSGTALAETSLSLMLSLSVLFYLLALKGHGRITSLTYYLLCGIFVGLAALNKHPAILILFFFCMHLVLNKRSLINLLYIIVGGFIIFIIENIYLYLVSGDPLFLYHMFVNVIEVNREYTLNRGNLPLTFYLYYTFIKIHCVGLYFHLALFGLIYTIVNKQRISLNDHEGIKFLVTWGMSMVFIMTFLPISFQPILFIHKQTNYMMMFSVPFIIISGYTISLIKKKYFQYAVILILCFTSIFSAIFQMHATKSHTYNSVAAFEFIKEFPEAVLITGRSNTYYFQVYNIIHPVKVKSYSFDEVINEETGVSGYRYSKKPGDDEHFISEIGKYNNLLILYDTRMAKWQGSRFYYPDPTIFTNPKNQFELITVIKKKKNKIDICVEKIFKFIIVMAERFNVSPSYLEKVKSSIQDLLCPDPAYLYYKK